MENRSLIYCVQPEELASHNALVRTSLDFAREVLKPTSTPDTFLGRPHYELMPLSYERE